MAKYLTFPSENLMLYQKIGQQKDKLVREIVSEGVGVKKKKVIFKDHTLISGPPGVGKSFSTADILESNKIKSIDINAGQSDISLAVLLAVNVYKLKKNEKLVVVVDDADDVIFKDYQSLNKWKIAFGQYDPERAMIPTYNHDRNVQPLIDKYRKIDQEDIAQALESFQEPGVIGLRIPTHQLKFIVLCNRKYKDPDSLGKVGAKMRSAIAPVIDRFTCRHINLNKDENWGWLAFTLANSQPFANPSSSDQQKVTLSEKQKKTILQFVLDKWSRFHSHSYRTVGEMAEHMVNDPKNYLDRWEAMLI